MYQKKMGLFSTMEFLLTALGSLESLAPTVSIETELAMEQLKEKYEQEIQDLKIQLETKVKIKKKKTIY